MIRVMLIDDHASFRQPLALMLDWQPDITVVGQAGTLAEARLLLPDLPVDVVILDLNLRDGTGLDLIPEIRQAKPKTAVLVLSASMERLDVARVVEAGAAGLLNKAVEVTEIVAVLRHVYGGGILLSQKELISLLRLTSAEREQSHAAQVAAARLTPREREVLQELAMGHTDKEIASRLHVSTDTARNHVANVLRKLGVESRLQALVFAVRHGLVTLR